MLNLRRLFAINQAHSGDPLDAFMLRLRIATVVLALYWLALFTSTHVPTGLPDGSHWLPMDKIAHLTGYSILALLLAWTVLGSGQMTMWRGLTLWGIVASYGVFDEVTQRFVPPRTPDPKDWLADALGAGIGLSLFAWFGVLTRRRRSKSD